MGFFSVGQYKIRQRGNKYYVYIVEKDERGNVKETYVGPLDKIVETYLKLKNGIGGVGVSPTVDRPGFEPGTSR
ncbi:integrase, partial [Sulfolobus sp. A20-N-F8]